MKIKNLIPTLFVGGFLNMLVPLSVFAQEAVPPNGVDDLTAIAGDKQITLNWKEATDDGVIMAYKIYYGVNSVETIDDSYDDEITTPDAQTSYTLKNLQNGTTYYFSVTAIDDEDIESEEYSYEVSAKPVSKSGSNTLSDPTSNNKGNPTAISAEQISNSEVIVNMSESVKIKGGTSSLTFEEKISGRKITIQDVSVNSNKILITINENSLDANNTYRITPHSLIEDLSGNPVLTNNSVEFRALFFTKTSSTPSTVLTPPVTNKPAYSVAPKDTTPPLDPTDLNVDSTHLEEENIVIVSWKLAPNIDRDISDQIIYTRKGLGEWDDGISIGALTSDIDLDVTLNENYQIKIVSVDLANNESNGAVLTFSTHLSQSGPGGSVVALILVLFMTFMFVSSVKRTD